MKRVRRLRWSGCAVFASCLIALVMTQNGVSAKTPPAPSPATVVDARHFGAVGDGKTDDTPAIQKALDAAARSVPVCFLPPGLYRLNGRLTAPAGVTLRGASGAAPHSEHPIGAGRWKSLGTFDFAEDAEVRLFARDADGNVVADAVKWVPRP